jgi:hypothetical protein
MAIAAMIAMIAITIISSMSVNPRDFAMALPVTIPLDKMYLTRW